MLLKERIILLQLIWLLVSIAQLLVFLGMMMENPSPGDVDDYSNALNEGGVEHHFYRYDNAGHAFQSFNSEACLSFLQ